MARPFPLYRARTILLTFLIIQAVPALNRLRPRSNWLHSLQMYTANCACKLLCWVIAALR
jgi:hypothetical protein